LVRLRDPRDGPAWGEFVDLYGPLVYGYLRKQGLQDADAADLSQETLVAVAGAVGRLEYDPGRGAFRNWLFTVVRRKLANWRASSAQRAVAGGTATHDLLASRAAPEEMEAAWETEWEERLVAWACEQVRAEVTPSTWEAFRRTALKNQSGKQVAADLGLSIAAVYHARSRILARLKALVRSAQEFDQSERDPSCRHP
jgi:RNA polymerase sigma-70 factor (ECF subfamily)